MRKLLLLLIATPLLCFSQQYELVQVAQGSKKISLRGLSVVNDKVAWASGSEGYAARTLDGGNTWEWLPVKGFEKADFRDIQAFSDTKAIAMGIGSPAYVLMTNDGGKSWEQVYKNTDSLIFYDGMDFWDKRRGLIYGDPINDKLQVISTKDGGKSWSYIGDNIEHKTAKGESSFAASGSGVRMLKGGNAWIVTGGGASNIYHTTDYGKTWDVNPLPILIGDGAGAFSVAFKNANDGIVVGGCFKRKDENVNNVLLTSDGGKTWRKPKSPVLGFRSAVIYITDKLLIATGTSGTDISEDAGETWTNISKLTFHSVEKSSNGKLVLLTNGYGGIFRLQIK